MGSKDLWYTSLLAILSLLVVKAAYLPESESLTSSIGSSVPSGCEYSVQDGQSKCSVPYSPLLLQRLRSWNVYQLEVYSGDRSNDSSSIGTSDLIFTTSGFSNLKYLHVQGIPIPYIDERTFQDSPGLMTVSITSCDIENVAPKSFDGLMHLTTLNLTRNIITTLPPNTFRHLGNLETIDLSRNLLVSLPKELFHGLPHLKEINLSWNLLQNLPADLFSSQTHLQSLNLRGNDLFYVENILYNLKSIQTLHLSNNNIEYIGPDSVRALSNIESVHISRNPFQCTCLLEDFIMAVLNNRTRFGNETFTCYGPREKVLGLSFTEVVGNELPCEEPKVKFITSSLGVLHHSDLHLDCQVTGSPPLGQYWITPWGPKFVHPHFAHLLPNDTTDRKARQKYGGVTFDSTVYANADGSLHIDRFRGYFAGEFKCVSISPLGKANSSVSVQVKTVFLPEYYISLYVGGICAGSLLVIGIIIGTIRFVVNRFCHSEGCSCCCCRSEDDVGSQAASDVEGEGEERDDGEVEIHVYADEDELEYHYANFYDINRPPKVPVNSPLFRTPRMSPKKCPTPSEGSDTEKPVPSNIWETLEEAKARLKYGAERKMQRVRCHVKSITSTGTVKIKRMRQSGSLKIQSMKETGSHAASVVRNGVVLGMEQVKYGVMSIKEFCGTGEMGPGTVSAATISSTCNMEVPKEEVVGAAKSLDLVTEVDLSVEKQEAKEKSKTV